MIKWVTHVQLGPIWYHSDVPSAQTSLLVWTFFTASYSKPALIHLPIIPFSDFIFCYDFSGI